MRKPVAALMAAALLASPAVAQEGEEPDAVALAFVEQFSDDHLSGMLSRIGSQAEALRALGQFDGQTVATVFDAQIDAAVRQHGDEWAHNMALAWDPLLTEPEMQSLVEEGAGSPYADKYLANRESAAASMAELSSELFGEILQQVVTDTVAMLMPETPTNGTSAPGTPTNEAPATEAPANEAPANEAQAGGAPAK